MKRTPALSTLRSPLSKRLAVIFALVFGFASGPHPWPLNAGGYYDEWGNWIDDGSYSDGSYSDGSYSDGSYSDGSYSDGSYSDGSYSDGSYSDGSYSDGSYSDGSYSDGSYSDGSYSDGSYTDGSYTDGSYTDGSYTDGSYSEGSYSDGSYSHDPYSMDSDGDGLSDGEEMFWGTDPMNADTDGDGLSDFQEIYGFEIYLVTTYGYYDESTGEDSSYTESWTQQVFTDPLVADTDGDGIPDGAEYFMGFNPADHADGWRDDDGDGLRNGEELQFGTGMQNPDTDGDGYSDGEEVLAMGTNPLDPNSPPPPASGDSTAMDSSGETDPADGGLSAGEPAGEPSAGGDSASDPGNDSGTTDHPDSGADEGEMTDEEPATGETEGGESQTPDNGGDLDNSELAQWRYQDNPNDIDGDGLPDYWERAYGLDPTDPSDRYSDTDGDGLTAAQEFALGANPLRADTDGDGLSDGEEVRGISRTGDYASSTPGSVGDWQSIDVYDSETGDYLGTESVYVEAESSPSSTFFTDPRKTDTDGDGYSDGWEIANGTNPSNPFDTLPGGNGELPEAFQYWQEYQLGRYLDQWTDSDGDGLSDSDEFYRRTDPFSADTDGDGFSDGEEVWGVSISQGSYEEPNTYSYYDEETGETHTEEYTVYHEGSSCTVTLDPANPDTDGDGYPDGYDPDPTDPRDGNHDTDGDGLGAGREHAAGSNPHLVDSDGDGIDDGTEVLVLSPRMEALGLPPFHPADPADGLADWDGDGLTNAEEIALGTDFLDADTDGDGFTDGVEVLVLGTDPLDPNDPGEDNDEENAPGEEDDQPMEAPGTEGGDSGDGTGTTTDGAPTGEDGAPADGGSGTADDGTRGGGSGGSGGGSGSESGGNGDSGTSGTEESGSSSNDTPTSNNVYDPDASLAANLAPEGATLVHRGGVVWWGAPYPSYIAGDYYDLIGGSWHTENNSGFYTDESAAWAAAAELPGTGSFSPVPPDSPVGGGSTSFHSRNNSWWSDENDPSGQSFALDAYDYRLQIPANTDEGRVFIYRLTRQSWAIGTGAPPEIDERLVTFKSNTGGSGSGGANSYADVEIVSGNPDYAETPDSKTLRIKPPIIADIHQQVFLTLLPVELLTDIENDGQIGGADSPLAQKAFQEGATEEDLDKGTEFLFYNDQLSNGSWDNEDPDNDSQDTQERKEDDDAQEITIKPGITEGEVWLTHPAIAALSFYSPKEGSGRTGRECHPDDKCEFSGGTRMTLSETKKFPSGKIFVRADGDLTFPTENPQFEGDLILKIKVGSQEIEAAKIKLTIIEQLGAEHYFEATRDYIFEENRTLHAADLILDQGRKKYRVTSLRSEVSRMRTLDTFNQLEPDTMGSPGPLKGIDLVVGNLKGTGAVLVLNGNYQFTYQAALGFAGISTRLGDNMTNACEGRFVNDGLIKWLPSDDVHGDYSGPTASYIAAEYQNSLANPVRYTFSCGRVPGRENGTNPRTYIPHDIELCAFRSALGGLVTTYESANEDASSQMIGYWEGNDEDSTHGVVFAVSQLTDKFRSDGGVGGKPQVAEAAQRSGVKELPGLLPDMDPAPNGNQRLQLGVLDCGTSIALAYANPDGNLERHLAGKKHFPDRLRYYLNIYIYFESKKPRP